MEMKILWRNFIVEFCVGRIFWKINFQNKLRFSNVYLQFIARLKPTVLSANLHIKTSYTTDGANISKNFSDVVDSFRTSFILSCICTCIFTPRGAVDCTESFVPQNLVFFWLLVCYCFNFSKIKNTQ